MLLTTHHHCDCALSPHSKWQLCPHWESTQSFCFLNLKSRECPGAWSFIPSSFFYLSFISQSVPWRWLALLGCRSPHLSPVAFPLHWGCPLPSLQWKRLFSFHDYWFFTWWPKLSKPAFKGLGPLPQDRIRCFVRSSTGYLNQSSAKAHLLPSC